MLPSLSFTAHVVPGMGRGKSLGTPTLNLRSDDVPLSLSDGVHACFVELDSSGKKFLGVLFSGDRPVFGDPPATEVHVIDEEILDAPKTLKIHVMEYLRPVMRFSSPEELSQEIENDIRLARGILNSQ